MLSPEFWIIYRNWGCASATTTRRKIAGVMRLFARFSLIFLLLQPAFAGVSDIENQVSGPDLGVVETTIKHHAIIGFQWIDQPLNRIVLIKTPKSFCAIKYLSFSRAHDAKPATVFNTGEETFFAEADFYTKSKGSVVRLHLMTRSSMGFSHTFVFSRSNDRFFCGGEPLLWRYPTSTSIRSEEVDVSIASTQLTDFQNINFADPNTHWFKYEENRKIRVQ